MCTSAGVISRAPFITALRGGVGGGGGGGGGVGTVETLNPVSLEALNLTYVQDLQSHSQRVHVPKQEILGPQSTSCVVTLGPKYRIIRYTMESGGP